MPDDQKQDKFKGLGGTFRLDTTVPQVSSTEGAPAQVRQPIPAPAPSPNKVEDIREATNPDEAAKRIGEGFEGTVTGGLKMLGDIVLPPGKTEGERLKYLGKKYVTGPLNAAAAEAMKQGPGIQQVATVGETLPGVGPMAVAPVVEPIKAASKSPTAALTTSQNLAGQAGAITLLAPAFEGAKAGAEGVVSGLGETAQTALGAAGEEVGNMARATAPEGSTEAGRIKLNVKGKPAVAPAAEWTPPTNIEKGISRDEAVSTDIPLSKLSVSEPAYNATASDIAKGRGSKTTEPISVVYNPQNGQYLVEDGMHRVVQAHQSGKPTISAKLHSGYSDTASVLPDEKMDLTPEIAEAEPTIEHVETARNTLGAAGEEVGGMARATAPDGSTEAGRVKLNVKGKAAEVPETAPEPVGIHPDDLPRRAEYQDVNFSARDLQDSGNKVTAETIRKDYAGGDKNASIYQSYIPMEDLPSPKVVEEEEGGDFEREDYQRPRVGVPIKVEVKPNGKMEILDGNHRARVWEEQNQQYAPAWVVDRRHPNIENLSEDEKAERAEMAAESATLARAAGKTPEIAERIEPTITHTEDVNRFGSGSPAPQKMNVVRTTLDGKEAGRLNYVIDGDTASVKGIAVDPKLQGRGYGQQMYLRAADEARARGVKTLTSDVQGSTTMDAARAWESLKRKGYPIEKIESTKTGSPAYSWDLTKPQANTATDEFGLPLKSAPAVESKPNVFRAYHGTSTPVEFEEFSTEGPPAHGDEETGYAGTETDPTAYLGTHFAKEPQIANKFAMKSERWLKGRVNPEGVERPRVIPVDLNLKNPKDFGSESNLNQFIYEGDLNRAGYAGEELLNRAMEADGIEEPSEGGEEVDKWMQKYDTDPKFRAEQNEGVFQSHRGDDEHNSMLAEAAPELASQAKARLHEMGHDGVIYQNEVEGGTGYIAFHPKQIKSVFASPAPKPVDFSEVGGKIVKAPVMPNIEGLTRPGVGASARENQEYAVQVAERASREAVAAEAEGNFALANKKEFEVTRATGWARRFGQDALSEKAPLEGLSKPGAKIKK